ncbi:MAG: deoxyribodipyrimidine photolyase [Gemmatimonadota bacterium]|nr:MAG: deoxyribodipyrimidine photolyase [Gemmatimonadota bacterium]
MALKPAGNRVRIVSPAPMRIDGSFVLYYMTAFRRPRYNFALDRAVRLARELSKPLVVLEPLEISYRWANARHHRFLIEGMRDQAAALGSAPVTYYPYVEPAAGQIRGLLESVATLAAAVVTDDYPTFQGPRVITACQRLPVRVEAVDGNGIVPLYSAGQAFPTAHAFRRFMHRTLAADGIDKPHSDPFAGIELPLCDLPRHIVDRWRPVGKGDLSDAARFVGKLPLDQGVGPGWVTGGATTGGNRLRRFLEKGLERYEEKRNVPDDDGASGLSPYLHFGHLSTHEILEGVIEGTGWSAASTEVSARGGRAGWGLDRNRTAFVDQFITWRELGFNGCAYLPDYDRYDSLPAWAQKTLADHAPDPRDWIYNLEQFEAAETHDTLWNAAQRQLVTEGRIHNYLRMLWGKKILEWSESPQGALDMMIELNNKYALDGRDPNSYSGIFWVLGRYDRAWGPEREVFGKVRFMSSDNTKRKTRVTAFLDKYGRW